MTYSYPFDPTYGYDLCGLLRVLPPQAPKDFADVWQRRYRDPLEIDLALQLSPSAD